MDVWKTCWSCCATLRNRPEHPVENFASHPQLRNAPGRIHNHPQALQNADCGTPLVYQFAASGRASRRDWRVPPAPAAGRPNVPGRPRARPRGARRCPRGHPRLPGCCVPACCSCLAPGCPDRALRLLGRRRFVSSLDSIGERMGGRPDARGQLFKLRIEFGISLESLLGILDSVHHCGVVFLKRFCDLDQR